MRKFMVWIIPLLTGGALVIVMNASDTLVVRFILALILGFVSGQVFHMALKAYVIHEFQNVRWSITTTVEPAETEEV